MPTKKPTKRPVKTPSKKPSKKPVERLLKYARHPAVAPAISGVAVRLTDAGRWAKYRGHAAVVVVTADPEDPENGLILGADCNCKTFLRCPVSRAITEAAEFGFAATTVRRIAPTRRRSA